MSEERQASRRSTVSKDVQSLQLRHSTISLAHPLQHKREVLANGKMYSLRLPFRNCDGATSYWLQWASHTAV